MRIGNNSLVLKDGCIKFNGIAVEFYQAYAIWRLLENKQFPITAPVIDCNITVDVVSDTYRILINDTQIFSGDQTQINMLTFVLSRVLQYSIEKFMIESEPANNYLLEKDHVHPPFDTGTPSTYIPRETNTQQENQFPPNNIDQTQSNQKIEEASKFLLGLIKSEIHIDDEVTDKVKQIMKELFNIDTKNITTEALKTYVITSNELVKKATETGIYDPVQVKSPELQYIKNKFEIENDPVRKNQLYALLIFLSKIELLASIDLNSIL